MNLLELSVAREVAIRLIDSLNKKHDNFKVVPASSPNEFDDSKIREFRDDNITVMQWNLKLRIIDERMKLIVEGQIK